MKQLLLKVHPNDNLIVALQNLEKGQSVAYNGHPYTLPNEVPAKHKFVAHDVQEGQELYMYGVLVGKAQMPLAAGTLITTSNVVHAAGEFALGNRKLDWHKPDVSKWSPQTFMGYHRSDGSVGTANYWIVVPMVFCENRNLDVIREALHEELGYAIPKKYKGYAAAVKQLVQAGKSVTEILNADINLEATNAPAHRFFENVDGIKFLNHAGGCGGIRQDAQALCGLLAGYITHPNVAGATVLSLGCQNAQVQMLQDEIAKRAPGFDKPLYILEQQNIGTESELIKMAIRQTFAGLMQANTYTRTPAPLSKLVIGLECGGSDGPISTPLRLPRFKIVFLVWGGGFGVFLLDFLPPPPLAMPLIYWWPLAEP